MVTKDCCKSSVKVIGRVSTDITLDHECNGIQIYTFKIEVPRSSGAIDEISVLISKEVIDYIGVNIESGREYLFYGDFRSHIDEQGKLKLFIFARGVYKYWKKEETNNHINVVGHISKMAGPRVTPKGRKILEIMVTVNTYNGKIWTIPCIVWNPEKYEEVSFELGKMVALVGRVQSRNYEKRYDDDTCEIKTTYEVSVKDIEAIDEDETVN